MGKSKQTTPTAKSDRWARPPRLPLADFFHPHPAHVRGITELGPRRTATLKKWLMMNPNEPSMLIIHRNKCNISRHVSTDCDCEPTYLVTGAQA